MNPFAIPQTLILPPETPFADVRAALEGLGFTQADSGIVTRPIIEGEPELASWSLGGELPFVHYTFNPVVRLRLLEVATVPPELRAEIAVRLAPLPGSNVDEALRSGDERQRLFGIWAAVETERLDLIADVRAVHDGASGVLREEAETALHRLGDMAKARLSMLTGARMIADAAMDLLAALRDPAALAAAAPDEGECAALFHVSVADDVWSAVKAMTPSGRGIEAQPPEAAAITAAPAGAFRWPNELSAQFPQGYRTIAGWMEPSRIWLAWEGLEPDGGKRLLDGLAFVDGRWVFLPKPWRILEPLILGRRGAAGAIRH